MNTPPSAEEELFHRALALPAAERATFLDRECAGAPALRAAVESLLRYHAEAPSFLKTPAPGVAETVAAFSARPAEKAGDRIGRYKLLQQIGEGGCGVVYMAEQEEPVRRRVALKVIKLGMDTKSVIARFEAERQALAMMDHPNIAKVLDAGATDTGRPFFVMELVRGVPITTYCDEQNLPTAQRLDLFSLVCHAIQHAHQKGIIHRDIKPSNVLVTVNDGEPVPKVIDFGIAKATQGRLTDATVFTAFEQFIGTPAYMSPEQVAMTSLDIDTRSDIYSLGVLLYELLTGRPPFDPKTFVAAGLDEMRRMIREIEPPKPSARLSTLADADRTTIARLRNAAPAQHSTQLSGDLDWIVMKALDKNRARRYESASSFAADIQRHLGHQPVIARPPSRAYLFQKLVTRHKAAFAAGAAIAAALVIGAGLATWQALRATRAERTARLEAAKSEKVASALGGVFSHIGPSVMRGPDRHLLRAMLDEGLRRFPKDFADQPEVLADIYGALGGIYYDLGDEAQWVALARQRLELIRSAKKGPTFEEVDALGVLALVALEKNDVTGAERLAREALELAGRLETKREEATVAARNALASVHSSRREHATAARISREVVALQRQRLGSQHLDVADALLSCATQEAAAGDPAAGEAMRREALAIRRQHLPKTDSGVIEATLRVAECQFDHGAYREAEAMLRDLLSGLPQPLPVEMWSDVANAQGLLANVLFERNDSAGAVALCRERLAFVRENFGLDHFKVGSALGQLSGALRRKGDYAEAEPLAREFIASWERQDGREHVSHAVALSHLARILLDRGDPAGAETLAREALELVTRLHGADSDEIIPFLNRLAEIKHAQRDRPGAVALRRRIVALQERSPEHFADALIQSRARLGRALAEDQQFAEAEALLQAAWTTESRSKYYLHERQRSLLDDLLKLYRGWAAVDASKAPLAAKWQADLAAFDLRQRQREAAAAVH